jgi:hypothetical protein
MSQEAYLRLHYGITVAERDAIMAEQNNRCSCCGRPFDETCRTEVDHEHYKVVSRRSENGQKGWEARANLSYVILSWQWAKTKEQAIKLAKKAGLRRSVRGILCGGRYAGCNRRLGKIDRIPWLENVLIYLKAPPARIILQS